MRIIIALVSFLVTPIAASAATITSLEDLLLYATDVINMIIPILFGIALLFFLWGVVKYIKNGGEPKAREEARNFMIFGIIGLFVMVSVWGLVRVLVNTFFESGVPQPFF